MLDVGGQDATEAFEDVGHSDEAREILDGLLVGTLKRMVRIRPPPGPEIRPRLIDKQPGDPAPKINQTSSSTSTTSANTGMGIGLYAVILIGGAAAFGAYKYMQSQQTQA